MKFYGETLMKKKFQVEATIIYKDVGGQTSLFHQLTCFKARISRANVNNKLQANWHKMRALKRVSL